MAELATVEFSCYLECCRKFHVSEQLFEVLAGRCMLVAIFGSTIGVAVMAELATVEFCVTGVLSKVRVAAA